MSSTRSSSCSCTDSQTRGAPVGHRLAFVGVAFAVIAIGAGFVRAYPGHRSTHVVRAAGTRSASARTRRATPRSWPCARILGTGDPTPAAETSTAGRRFPQSLGVVAVSTEDPSVGGLSDSSTESHWQSLRDGVRTVLENPLGFGLGNAGSTGSRTGVEIKAGESRTRSSASTRGASGGPVFIAWSAALLCRVREWALVLASLAAVLALGLQTDVIGVPWLACVIWALAGSCVARVTSRLTDHHLCRGSGAARDRADPRRSTGHA